jgi:decaprenylphospho-beta-D-ribofuranose 2-oxidase
MSDLSPPPPTATNDRDAAKIGLRATAPLRVLDGFGGSMRAASLYLKPRSLEEVEAAFEAARADGLTVAFRGAGRSYGDAAIHEGGVVLDMTGLDRMLGWDPVSGIAECQPGLTIEGLWRRTITDGYWPAVVPGTMRPTLGGCLAANVHGKNNFKVGPIGDHVLDFDLLTTQGKTLRCSREENADVFHAAIGGLGLLGAFTRIRLKLRKVETGWLRVKALATANLADTFAQFEANLGKADYLVGWIDGTAGGRALGRGQLHVASYVRADEDPDPETSFHVERQTLPDHVLGVPKSILWRFMKPFMNNAGVRLVNGAKMLSSRLANGKTYLQSHVAFAFLLDYVPNWRLAYGPSGFLQYQVFLPKESAQATLRELLELTQKRGMPSYLAVLKRHRPDAFLLTHALDGWSLAMDLKVPPGRAAALEEMTREMTERVLAAGGRFYFAKDGVLRAEDALRYLGADTVKTFLELKSRLDPNGLLSSNLGRRIFATEPGSRLLPTRRPPSAVPTLVSFPPRAPVAGEVDDATPEPVIPAPAKVPGEVSAVASTLFARSADDAAKNRD